MFDHFGSSFQVLNLLAMLFKYSISLRIIELITSQTPPMGSFILGFRELLGKFCLLSLPFGL
jgi:hypothetical protein